MGTNSTNDSIANIDDGGRIRIANLIEFHRIMQTGRDEEAQEKHDMRTNEEIEVTYVLTMGWKAFC